MLTFLFTDLESSTRLWERHPEAMRGALQRHDEILRTAIEDSAGAVVKTTGDGVMAVFEDPSDAVAASLRAQHGMMEEAWDETGPLRVRVGIHTGEAQKRTDDYFGPTVNRAARIMSAAHGGQVILSQATNELLRSEISLRDLGEHRLKDLAGPERLYQILEAGLPETFPPLVTLDLRPNNLPTQMSVFLGRDNELTQLRALLDDEKVRLVTMTGPGGTGKTRLALQAAADNIDRFADGLYFVELAAEREAEAALSAIVRTVGIDTAGEDPPIETLKRALEPRQLLLLLDNFEQVTEAALPVAELLAGCPRLEVLITSREALNVRGERVYPVNPLSLPSPGSSAEAMLSSEAVQLLVERASEIRSDFELTNDNAGAIAAICIRLDGLPLPIELAAARLKLFSPHDLLDRLESRLDLLRSGARDLPSRQQTLRGTIEWSYDLLAESERRLFQLFGVFSGADYASIEAVGERTEAALGAGDVMDGLESLVDKSLIRSVETNTGGRRFSMLETIREYALERLADEPETLAAVRQAHAEHYLSQAVRTRPDLVGNDRDRALAAVAPDVGNLQAAWRYFVGERDLLRLNEFLDPLWTIYDAQGWYHGAIELANDLLELLSLEPKTQERLRDEISLQVSLARALMAIRGYTAEVEDAFSKALALSEDAADVPHRFPVLRSLASLYLLRGDFEKSAAAGRELLALATDQNDPALGVDAHLVLGASLISADESLEHLDEAISLFEPSRADSERFRLGPLSGVAALTASALLLWMLGFPDRSLERSARAARVTEEISHPYSKAYALFHMAFLDLLRQDFESVSELANELLAMANAYDYQIWRALALVLLGTTRVASGDPSEGVAQVESGMALYQGMTTPPVFWPMVQNLRAQAWAKAGKVPEALELIAATMDERGEPSIGDPENALLRGDLLLRLPEPDNSQAELWFTSAHEVSKAMGMRMTQLHAATRLAQLKRGTGDESNARETLAAIYDTFTEGFDTPELIAARAALDH